MKKWQAICSNIIMWAVPVLNIWQPIIPEKSMKYVIPGLAAISIFSVKKTSESNPDGTDARVAYEKQTTKASN